MNFITLICMVAARCLDWNRHHEIPAKSRTQCLRRSCLGRNNRGFSVGVRRGAASVVMSSRGDRRYSCQQDPLPTPMHAHLDRPARLR
jgi:hypothetical protein